MSRGTLAPPQTIGVFLEKSMFVNDKLPYIFLQLLLSEKIGIGVPKIVETYGKEYFEFWKNSIVVKIPFNWINVVGDKVGNKVGNKKID